ncbi:MAG: hypothetical protein RLZZ385_2412 [Pseudomonadota bacterium]|jgi:release factor glutamine methyltransferase
MAATIADCLSRAKDLQPFSDTWRLDGELLLAEAMACSRTALLTHPQQELSAQQESRFNDLLARRLKGEPVAYLLGHREFWSLDLQVNAAVLIPRPETELLVELALNIVAEAGSTAPVIVDLGTGSGAIALALASELPAARVWGVDNSAAALAVAIGNADRLGLQRVQWVLSDWFAGLGDRTFNLIVSNPPYIASQDPHLLEGDLRFEPQQALVSAGDGLQDIRRLIDQGRTHLCPGGWLLLEHGWQQGEAVRDLLRDAGYDKVAGRRDLAGLDRVSYGHYDP